MPAERDIWVIDFHSVILSFQGDFGCLNTDANFTQANYFLLGRHRHGVQNINMNLKSLFGNSFATAGGFQWRFTKNRRGTNSMECG